MSKPPEQITPKQLFTVLGVIGVVWAGWSFFNSTSSTPTPQPVTQSQLATTPTADPPSVPSTPKPVASTPTPVPPADPAPTPTPDLPPTPSADSASSDPSPVDTTALDSTSSDTPAGDSFAAPTPGDDLGLVTYKVSSSCPTDVTYTSDGGSTQQESSVPDEWTTDVSPGMMAYISAQVHCEGGDVTTTITQGGTELKTATSSGDYVIATASYP